MEVDGKGRHHVWFPPFVVDRLRFLRGPGESYSDVIIRLTGRLSAARRTLVSVDVSRRVSGCGDGVPYGDGGLAVATIDLPDDELAAVIAALRRAIEEDRYPRAPRLDRLRAALGRLEAVAGQPRSRRRRRPARAALVAAGADERQARADRELEERGLRDMARKARDGEYSDFASPHVLPIIVLVQELEAAGRPDLAARAKNGDFGHER